MGAGGALGVITAAKKMNEANLAQRRKRQGTHYNNTSVARKGKGSLVLKEATAEELANYRKLLIRRKRRDMIVHIIVGIPCLALLIWFLYSVLN